jgi:hypothetical protein
VPAGRRRLLAFAALTIVTSLLGGAALGQVMAARGYSTSPFPITIAGLGGIGHNVELLVQGYTKLAGGDFSGIGAGVRGVATFASGVLALGALGVVLIAVGRRIVSVRRRPPDAGESFTPQFAYVVFWTISLLVTGGVFLMSTAPLTAYSGRYLLAGYVAVGALLPLAARRSRRSRVVLTTAVCLFALSAIYEVSDRPFDPGRTYPGPHAAGGLVRFADQQRVSFGYAGYWDAADLTWGTNFRVKLYPVLECVGQHRLCTFPWVQISSWYTPRPGVRSLLVLHPGNRGVTGVDPALGQPVGHTTIDGLAIYVFPYDIASKLTSASLTASGRVTTGAAPGGRRQP